MPGRKVYAGAVPVAACFVASNAEDTEGTCAFVAPVVLPVLAAFAVSVLAAG